MRPRKTHDSTNAVVELIEVSAEATGAAAGAAIGIVGGPPGVIAGAAGGALFAAVAKRIGVDFVERKLSPRQLYRVSQGYTLALSEIEARIMGGDEIRTDRFFESEGEHRSTGEEILEGLLLRLADEYEERKIKFVQRIFSALVFEPSLPPEYGYFLIKVADEMTYRQLIFLSHFGGDSPALPDLPPEDKEILAHLRSEGSQVGAELMDMGAKGLLVVSSGSQTASLVSTFDSQAIAHFRTGLISPTRLARDLHQIMRLSEMPADEVDKTFRDLIGPAWDYAE